MARLQGSLNKTTYEKYELALQLLNLNVSVDKIRIILKMRKKTILDLKKRLVNSLETKKPTFR